MLGIDLGVVGDAELDRIDAELLRHLVHGDFERHHAGGLAGRAHGVAFRQVELGEAERGQAVGAGVEQLGLRDGGFRAAAGEVAADALMGDGE